MNQEQKEVLSHYTCGILDAYNDMENYLKTHGIDKKYIKKLSKAFDMIHEVNQECFKK